MAVETVKVQKIIYANTSMLIFQVRSRTFVQTKAEKFEADLEPSDSHTDDYNDNDYIAFVNQFKNKTYAYFNGFPDKLHYALNIGAGFDQSMRIIPKRWVKT